MYVSWQRTGYDHEVQRVSDLLLFPRRREREAQQRERDEAEAQLVSGRRGLGGEGGGERSKERERGEREGWRER